MQLILDCPVRTLGDIYARKHIHAPLYRTSSEEFHDTDIQKPSQWYSTNRSKVSQNMIFAEQNLSNFTNEERHSNSCIPRYHLVRIQNAQKFSRDYLLRVSTLKL